MHAALTRSSPSVGVHAVLADMQNKYPEARQGLRALQQGCYHRYLSALQPAAGAWASPLGCWRSCCEQAQRVKTKASTSARLRLPSPQTMRRSFCLELDLGFCGRWRITSSAFKELAWLLQELLTVRDLQATLHGDNCAFPPAGVASCSVAALFFGKAKASLHYLCCLWKGPQHRATCLIVPIPL